MIGRVDGVLVRGCCRDGEDGRLAEKERDGMGWDGVEARESKGACCPRSMVFSLMIVMACREAGTSDVTHKVFGFNEFRISTHISSLHVTAA